MTKILSTENITQLANQLHQQNKRIVLVGGCFDILHIGHITFLEEAKKQGEILVVLLESDQTIAKTKGTHRPINTQNDRAQILAALTNVDYVIKLPSLMTDKLYDDLVIALKPAIIATTSGDKNRVHKERQAQLVQAHLIDVTPQISDKSTTKLIKLLDEL
jgi:rfaE bifunctional protein nucleotidyltransferase chain/domain